jgi:hypothetical protein
MLCITVAMYVVEYISVFCIGDVAPGMGISGDQTTLILNYLDVIWMAI